MSLKTEIIARLNATVAVTAIVSNRIAWGSVEQEDTVPYIVCQQISDVPVHSLNIERHAEHKRLQVDLVTATAAQADALAAVVKAALDCWSKTSATPPIRSVLLIGEHDDTSGPVPPGGDMPLSRIMQEYSVWHD